MVDAVAARRSYSGLILYHRTPAMGGEQCQESCALNATDKERSHVSHVRALAKKFQ
jgi:hypothetical protein